MDLHAACRLESEWWRQKSRCKWLIEGDKNTGFFHKHAEARKNHNNVNEIQTHDRVINQFEEIKSEASRHFNELFKDQPVVIDAELLSLTPRMVTNIDNKNLKELITMDEVKKAIDSMEEDRAPGPDGYNVNFIKIY